MPDLPYIDARPALAWKPCTVNHADCCRLCSPVHVNTDEEKEAWVRTRLQLWAEAFRIQDPWYKQQVDGILSLCRLGGNWLPLLGGIHVPHLWCNSHWPLHSWPFRDGNNGCCPEHQSHKGKEGVLSYGDCSIVGGIHSLVGVWMAVSDV